MDIKCPHCETAYEVGKEYLHQRVQCEICGNKFVVEEEPKTADTQVSQSPIPKARVVSEAKTKQESNPLGSPNYKHLLSRNNPQPAVTTTPRGVKSFAPSYVLFIVHILAYLGIVINTWGAINKAAGSDAMQLWLLVTLPFQLLLVRLAYEVVLAIFEIASHLREIRDSLC